MIKQIRRRLKQARTNYLSNKFQSSLTGKGWQDDESYEAYLSQQLKRTISKKDSPLRPHTVLLIDSLAAEIDLTGKNILCIGCRNTAELDYFESKQVGSVTGVDLYSEDDRVKIMDMHALDITDNQFDVLYSAHSLEHSINPDRAIAEFLRVVKPGGSIVIEVPIEFEPTAADLVDFESAEKLLARFEPHVARAYWSIDLKARRDQNEHGTAIARIGFLTS